MKSWVVSAHGGSSATGNVATSQKVPYNMATIPPGVELVTFTIQNQIFWGGNPELDALILGNENDPVITNRIKSIKKSGTQVFDHNAYGTNDFRSGIYEVGSKGSGKKAIDLPNGKIMKLSDILEEARKSGINKVYWLACTVLQ